MSHRLDAISSRERSNVQAWRDWAEGASPELLKKFNERSLVALRHVRSRYPSDCGNRHPAYMDLRRECVACLDQLATEIEAENVSY